LDPFVKSGKIKILYHIFIEKWSQPFAEFEMKTFLKLSGEKPDVILASGGTSSVGVIKALNEFGLAGKILVTVQDTDLTNCNIFFRDYRL
jgi:D-xylose transport system substrate-binding protein